MQLIGLTGRAGCGKDTIASFLCEAHGFVQIALADPLRDGRADTSTIVCANGTSFDFPILSHAYRACSMGQPWQYFNERDWRTVRKVGPTVEFERTGTHHNALDDACHQALHLQRVMARLHQLDMAEAA